MLLVSPTSVVSTDNAYIVSRARVVWVPAPSQEHRGRKGLVHRAAKVRAWSRVRSIIVGVVMGVAIAIV